MSLGSWLNERKKLKLDARQARKETKLDKVEVRQATKAIAYENGIDPNAWIANSISSVSTAAASIVSSTSGASVAKSLGTINRTNPLDTGANPAPKTVSVNGGMDISGNVGSNYTFMIIAAIVALFLFRR